MGIPVLGNAAVVLPKTCPCAGASVTGGIARLKLLEEVFTVLLTKDEPPPETPPEGVPAAAIEKCALTDILPLIVNWHGLAIVPAHGPLVQLPIKLDPS